MGGIVLHSGNGDGDTEGRRCILMQIVLGKGREGDVFVAELPPRSSSPTSSAHNSASVIAGLPTPPRLM
jgi:hypothetical protein